MALLSLSIKRPSEFLEVPPSPPQSPPVVDAAFSPPSPADSPVEGYLHLPLPTSGPFNGAPERAKKRRKQERPSLFVEDQTSCANEDDIDQEPGSAQSRHIEQATNYLAWHDMPISASDMDVSRPEKSPEACLQEEIGVPLSMSELHPSSAVVKTELSTESSPVKTSSSLSSMFQQQLPSGYPSSPAVGRVASACGGTGSDGEGEGSDGGVPETCPECRKVFKRRVYLQRHMAREHWSTAKVFKCDKCAYETKHQSNLLVHRRTHTGERPYHCGACGQRYTQGHLLKAHIRSRHGGEMAYYNMDKRSDGVRCRRSLTSTSRLDPVSTINPTGFKEDKIRFLLEAAEAARGGSSATRPAIPAAPPGGPFVGMSLGQYVNALSSCLPGTAGIRPLVWNPTQTFQTLPHDGLTSHAALLSSLAAAPMPSVQNITSTPSQPVSDRSILNSLLASYATGSPLFSINGLQTGNGSSGSAKVVGTSPLRCPSSESPAGPQDLSMSGTTARDGSDCRSTESENTPRLATTTTSSISTTLVGAGHTSTDLANGSPSQRQRTDIREGSAQLPNGLHIKMEEEQATDLSVKNVKTSEKSGMVPDATAGTVDLSARAADRKPTPYTNVNQKRDLASLQAAPADSKLLGNIKSGCCEDGAECLHLQKLKELRRNVYRMLSVFTPYLDVAGAGIADVEADAVDDFLHEVIYSSKLDQASTD